MGYHDRLALPDHRLRQSAPFLQRQCFCTPLRRDFSRFEPCCRLAGRRSHPERKGVTQLLSLLTEAGANHREEILHVKLRKRGVSVPDQADGGRFHLW